MSTIARLDRKRFDTEKDYKEAVISNIHGGWLFLDLPPHISLQDKTVLGSHFLLHLSCGKTVKITKDPGIHKINIPEPTYIVETIHL